MRSIKSLVAAETLAVQEQTRFLLDCRRVGALQQVEDRSAVRAANPHAQSLQANDLQFRVVSEESEQRVSFF
jgi:hypothetical protein